MTIVRNDDKKKYTVLIGVLVITFLSLSPVLTNPFARIDDDSHLVENPSIRGLDGAHLKAMFTRTTSKIYVPLTYLSYALEYALFGYTPLVYHLNNLLLHLGVTALVFFLAGRWGLPLGAAGLAALIFGIHPMHVESVAWITERKDVLYALFYLLALYHYQNYVEWQQGGVAHPRKKKRDTKSPAGSLKGGHSAYALTMVFGILSVLAKPMALSLPLILLVCDWINGRRFQARVFGEKIPFVLAMAPIVWVTYAYHMRVPGQGVLEALLIWIWTLTFYIKKFFFPIILFPGYVLPKPTGILQPPYAIAVGIVILGVLILTRFKKERWLVFAGLYYFVSIFFLLRYDDLWDANIVADRFMYLPSLGLCLWLGFVLDQQWSGTFRASSGKRFAWISLMVLLFTALSLKTFFQVRLWGDELSLWTQGIRASPRSFVALNARGNLYSDAGQYDLAIEDYSRALGVRPDYALAYDNRGIVYYHQGREDLALADYNRAVALNPRLDVVYVNRGLLYDDQDRDLLAMRDFNRAIKLNPDNPYAYNNRGRLRFQRREYDLAFADFSRALELKKDMVKAYVSRGNVFLAKGQFDLAMKDYDRALKIDPDHGGVFYNRSILYYMNKKFRPALEDALKAKALGFKVADNYIRNIRGLIEHTNDTKPYEGIP